MDIEEVLKTDFMLSAMKRINSSDISEVDRELIRQLVEALQIAKDHIKEIEEFENKNGYY